MRKEKKTREEGANAKEKREDNVTAVDIVMRCKFCEDGLERSRCTCREPEVRGASVLEPFVPQ